MATEAELLELRAIAEMELEQEQAGTSGVSTTTPTSESWLESGYKGWRDYAEPALKMGVDVGTGFAGSLTGPLGIVSQPIVSSAIGSTLDLGTRQVGEWLGFEPKTSLWDKVSNEAGDFATESAIGIASGGALNVAGKVVRKGGNMLFNNFDRTKALRDSLFTPGTLTDPRAIAEADATIASLRAQGIFPQAPMSQNPFADSVGRLETLAQREADTLGGLRTSVDRQMAQGPYTPIAPFAPIDRPLQSDVLSSPDAISRFGEYNHVDAAAVPDENTFFRRWGEESIDRPMNLSQIADKKAAYTSRISDFENPASYGANVEKTMGKIMQQKELEIASQHLSPEQFRQYQTSLSLYGDVQKVLPEAGQNTAGLSQVFTPNKTIGVSTGSQSGIRAFGSLGNVVADPAGIKLYNKAFTPSSGTERFLTEQVSPRMIQLGRGAERVSPVVGSLTPDLNSATAAYSSEPNVENGPLLQNLTEPKAVAISRNLNQIDAAAIEALIPAFVEDYNAQPLTFQLKRLVAEGDKSKIADFLGQMVKQYPDFPIQRGQVTGLPSEFDLGDGVARLISPEDKAEYERRVNVSTLDVTEKALRIKNIREQGIAHRLDTPIISTDLGLIKGPGTRYREQPSSSSYQFAPRQQTANGSRKIE